MIAAENNAPISAKANHAVEIEAGAAKDFGNSKDSEQSTIGPGITALQPLLVPNNPYLVFASLAYAYKEQLIIDCTFSKNVSLPGESIKDGYRQTRLYYFDNYLSTIQLTTRIQGTGSFALRLGAGFNYNHYHAKGRILTLNGASPFLLYGYTDFSNPSHQINILLKDYQIDLIVAPELAFFSKQLLISFGFKWNPYLISTYDYHRRIQSLHTHGRTTFGMVFHPFINLRFSLPSLFFSAQVDYRYTNATYSVINSHTPTLNYLLANTNLLPLIYDVKSTSKQIRSIVTVRISTGYRIAFIGKSSIL